MSYFVSNVCFFDAPQILDLFDWLVQPCLNFIDTECRFVIQTSQIHLAYSLMKLYTCLMG